MTPAKKLAATALLAGAAALAGLQNAQAALPIQHWTQASGAQVFLVESPALPMLDVQLDFDAGSRRDPPAQAGLAEAAALMAGKGVAGRDGEPPLDENQLGQAWADLGASFAASASDDRMSFTLRTLTDPGLLPKAVELAARQLGQPAWPDAVWQRERERLSAALKEARSRPGVVAQLAFDKAVFGQHPYGQETTPETLSRIGIDDLRQRYAAIAPCRAKVSLVGAVSREQADQIAAQLLSRLPQQDAAACPPLPPVAEVPALAAPLEQRIAFDSAQAHVLIGQPGYKRSDPAYFALLVGNHILGGGGFTSRLTEQVREKRGLSYSVYSYFMPGLHAGAFAIGLQTRPDQAGQALAVARQVLRDFVADGPTEAELQAAKDNLIGGFALRIDSNRKLLANVANIAWHDLPLDYLDHWSERVQSVTAPEIRAAFQRVLQPDRMVTVVLGGASAGQSTQASP